MQKAKQKGAKSAEQKDKGIFQGNICRAIADSLSSLSVNYQPQYLKTTTDFLQANLTFLLTVKFHFDSLLLFRTTEDSTQVLMRIHNANWIHGQGRVRLMVVHYSSEGIVHLGSPGKAW